MKLPKLPKLPSLKSLHLPSRITMERLLIVSAAALVVVLAVRGGQQTQTAMQQTDFTPDVSTQTIADASPDVEMTATVCWYEDGEVQDIHEPDSAAGRRGEGDAEPDGEVVGK
mgnify:CR=1 FL=1